MKNVEQFPREAGAEEETDPAEGEVSLELEKRKVPELTQEQKETIEGEEKWVKESFQELIDGVNERYDRSELSEAQKDSFKAHNEQILGYCIERGVVKGLSEVERAMLYFAAIRHDATKGDKAPAGKEGVSNYVLAKHGEAAAEEAGDFLQDESGIGYIDKILAREQGKEEYDKEKILTTIENAIKRHMGPCRRNETQEPFFMDKVLNGGNGMVGVNEQLPKDEQIKHPRPQNKIDKLLFAADMRSLASPAGTQKLLDIRAGVPISRQQDKEICTAYERKYGSANLKAEEAAFLSAFESAEQARDSIDPTGDPEDWLWINQAVEEVKQIKGIKEGRYRYVAKGERPEEFNREAVKSLLAKKEIYQKAKQAWREDKQREKEQREIEEAREVINNP